jgi:hypothetical protein
MRHRADQMLTFPFWMVDAAHEATFLRLQYEGPVRWQG